MSKFCLNPAGDTPSACRLFDSIVSMCVPVIVSDSIELPFEDVIDYRRIAIFVESNAALKPGFLVSMLRGIPTERILEYQTELNEVSPNLCILGFQLPFLSDVFRVSFCSCYCFRIFFCFSSCWLLLLIFSLEGFTFDLVGDQAWGKG